MSWEADYFAGYEERRAAELAAAEQRAREDGKELFDLARFEQLLNRGSQARHYYLLWSELRTLEAYAKKLLDHEPWEDTP